MNTTAKILPAHYFPNIILFKIFDIINLIFGVTIVAVDLKLLRKNKIKLPITIFFSPQAFYRDIFRLNEYVNRIFLKNIVQLVGLPNN